MKKLIVERKYFENVTDHQMQEMLADFKLDQNGNIILEYNPKRYSVNRGKQSFDTGIKAISMFSGAGGLDIGTQLAGVKVISSL
ncbi:MAG: DNA cytosine methyltransferase, partial [Clostridia bacterium]|nr:DNA cytosine methyltransferase [Clostridia bacterium]